MSASEKLKRLQTAYEPGFQAGVTPSRMEATGTVLAALPQIVAVVEAAEVLAANVHDSERVTDLAEEMDAALSALDEALS